MVRQGSGHVPARQARFLRLTTPRSRSSILINGALSFLAESLAFEKPFMTQLRLADPRSQNEASSRHRCAAQLVLEAPPRSFAKRTVMAIGWPPSVGSFSEEANSPRGSFPRTKPIRSQVQWHQGVYSCPRRPWARAGTRSDVVSPNEANSLTSPVASVISLVPTETVGTSGSGFGRGFPERSQFASKKGGNRGAQFMLWSCGSSESERIVRICWIAWAGDADDH